MNENSVTDWERNKGIFIQKSVKFLKKCSNMIRELKNYTIWDSLLMDSRVTKANALIFNTRITKRYMNELELYSNESDLEDRMIKN